MHNSDWLCTVAYVFLKAFSKSSDVAPRPTAISVLLQFPTCALKRVAVRVCVQFWLPK